MQKNPLLYSDHSEHDVEEINTIEPIVEKRSILFYFIVLANTLLVVLVLAVIWVLFTKPSNTTFDEQLKAWTQQIFETPPPIQASKEVTTPPVAVAEESVDTQPEPLQANAVDNEREQEELALKVEQERLEALALELQAEKEKAEAIQQTVVELKPDTTIIEVVTDTAQNTHQEEPAVVPNAAQSIPDQPNNQAKTQLEMILETMQTQE